MVERYAGPIDFDAISLRIHQIASAAGALAEGQQPPLSHALYLIEECLLDVEEWVESMRRSHVEAEADRENPAPAEPKPTPARVKSIRWRSGCPERDGDLRLFGDAESNYHILTSLCTPQTDPMRTKSTTLNFSLPVKMRSEVERRVAREAYGSVSEYVRELIRKDLRRREAVEQVDQLLLEGERSGKPIPVTKRWLQSLKAEVNKEPGRTTRTLRQPKPAYPRPA